MSRVHDGLVLDDPFLAGIPVVGDLGRFALQAGLVLPAGDVMVILQHHIVRALFVVFAGEAVSVDDVVVVGEVVQLVPQKGRSPIQGLPVVAVDVGPVLIGVAGRAGLQVETDGRGLRDISAVAGRPLVAGFAEKCSVR
jgi:hypothetical protein